MNASDSPDLAGKAFDFQLTRRVEFCDTDMAGIMHFSNYFRFMEATETAFLRSLGLSVLLSRYGLEVCLPRVHAECDYTEPLRFEDEVLVQLLVERKGTCSLAYQFRFYRVEGNERRPVARGRLVLACAASRNGRLTAVPLPKALAGKIRQAPGELLTEQFPPPASLPSTGNGAAHSSHTPSSTPGHKPGRTRHRSGESLTRES